MTIPNHLVEDILCYVPAIDLKRLRLTCKEWNRLFKDHRFQRKHSNKAAKQLLVLMLKNFMISPMRVNLHGTIPSLDVIAEPSKVDNASSNYLARLRIYRVFHCDGLLLCSIGDGSTPVVWNPLTGETRWIKAPNGSCNFMMGYYYQDKNKSCNKSYKILSYSCSEQDSYIYEFNSDSWRNIGDITLDYFLEYSDDPSVSLKGYTYFLATCSLANGVRTDLLFKFDFSTEISTNVALPYASNHRNVASSLSVVRQEKLSVLLERDDTSKTEIWVTNKIDETEVVSWSKVLTLDLSPDLEISFSAKFLLDEEKKIVVSCELKEDNVESTFKDIVSIVGEDNKVTQVVFGVYPSLLCFPNILNYVPSFVQIERVGGNKRKRGD